MARIRSINNRDRHGAAGPLAAPILAGRPLARRCPKCEAQPGQNCRRWISGRIRGQETGGGYWRPLKTVHDERKTPRPRKTDE